jgi:hypothetical protein
MDVLRIETDDLVLTVAANGVDVAYDRSKRKQQERIATCTSYTWSGIAQRAELFHGENRAVRPALKGAQAPPVFFENKDYVFEIDLKHPSAKDPFLHSRLKEVRDSFIHRRERNSLVGMLNFGNDLGRSDLVVRYERAGEPQEFRFEFEVFSTKLDQKSDLQRIMADIEREYPLLVLDVMRRTYSNFKSGSGPCSDLVWWQVFGGIYTEFIRSSQFIQNKPHSRLISKEQWERADRLKRLTPRLEEEVHRWRREPDHRYRTEHRSLSLDTPENRFFKYAATNVGQRFEYIRKRILDIYGKGLTEEYLNELDAVTSDLRTIRNHPLFRSVGTFAGLRQESPVLQRATGYSTVYKNWIMLQRGISFLEDLQRMETKNIADLYQIWCFLEMKNIVSDVLEREKPDEVDLGLVQEKGLVLQLAQGKGSRLGYNLEDGEVLELFHEFSISGKQRPELRSYTGDQCPDIALRIRKNDLKDDYILTYLFDAKYRLHSDEKEDAPDTPPPDALNQMHRYRDAIYYMDRKADGARPEKEVVGGYILFPGEGGLEQVKQQGYYQAIEQVNIGAFPLRPGDEAQRELLRGHVERIIEKGTGQLLADVRPQKRMRYDAVDPIVLVAVAKEGAQQQFLLSEHADRYHTGALLPGRFGDPRMRYFAPYFGKQGVNCYFEIKGYELMARNAIYPKGHPLHSMGDPSERLVLRLGRRHYIDGGRFFKTEVGVPYFRYTLLSLLRAPRNGKVELVLSQDFPS